MPPRQSTRQSVIDDLSNVNRKGERSGAGLKPQPASFMAGGPEMKWLESERIVVTLIRRDFRLRVTFIKSTPATQPTQSRRHAGAGRIRVEALHDRRIGRSGV